MSIGKKTIIFISNESKLLGATKVLLSIIKYFNSTQRYNIFVICPIEGPFKTALEQEGISTLIPECLRNFYRHVSQPARFLLFRISQRIHDNLKLFFYFYQLFQSYPNAVIYANTSVVRYLAFPALLSRTKLLWHVHEYSDNPWKQKFHSFLIRHCADKIILHSQYLISRMQLSRYDQRKILFFRYPTILDPKDYRQLQFKQTTYDLIFSGKISLEKGVLDLLMAINYIVRVKKDLKVVMTGLFVDKDKEVILDFVAKNKLDQYVTFPGFVPDLKKYILESRIVVLPTYRDYFPLVLLEAVMLEKPVICTNVGDIRSIVTHNINGLIVSPGDIQQLTEAIKQMLDDQTYNRFVAGTKEKKTEILSNTNDYQKLEQALSKR